jgi:hypothetical protein
LVNATPGKIRMAAKTHDLICFFKRGIGNKRLPRFCY